jgi:beta-lactamase class A
MGPPMASGEYRAHPNPIHSRLAGKRLLSHRLAVLMSPPIRIQNGTRIGRQSNGAIRVGRDPELERFERSLQESRKRRAVSRRRTGWRWRHAGALGAVFAAWWLLVGTAELDPDASNSGAGEARSAAFGPAVLAHDSSVVPAASAIDQAWSYARERGGLVSLAVIDSEGRMHSFKGERAYVSASVVKALLLAAELERREAAGFPLDDTTRALLTQMITISDNDAAEAIYYRVGDAGLYEAASRTGMKSFSVAGYWANSQITAEDMARLMWRLDDVLDGAHREFGLGLLGSVTASQRWGIPQGAGPGWDIRFKGGWRATELGQLVHQAAELRNEDGRLALAVLTDAQPSQAYAVETLRGVADRLVGPLSTEPWDGSWRG